MLKTEDAIEEVTEILDEEKLLEQEKHKGLSSRMLDVSVSENVQSLDEKSRNELEKEKTLKELTCRFCNKTVKGPLRNHFKECTAQKRQL